MSIHQLPLQLANQIAAGEVIERPASAIKELMENSLDAQPQSIIVELEKGGKKLIQVSDDGLGINKDDLTLALSRHATSKIRELADLQAISTLGFRGEALASLSSISQLTLISKTADAEQAWQIQVQENTAETMIKPAAHPVGTTVQAKNLFFNTPARRKFLRADLTECGHAEAVFKQLSLINYQVALTLKHNDKVIYNLPKADNIKAREQRISKVCGKQFMDNALYFDIEATGLRCWGWVGLPSYSRNQSDLQYCYLNGRLVRDRVLNHAIKQAYQESLPTGRYATYVIYLELDPASVDVNVHPTKHEVRFHDSRLVHDFLFTTLKKVIHQEIVTPIETVESELFTTQPMINTVKSYEKPLFQQAYDKTPTSKPSSSLYSSARQVQEPPVDYQRSQLQTNQLTQEKIELGELVSLINSRFGLTKTDHGVNFIDIKAVQAVLLNETLKQQRKSLQTLKPLLMPLTLAISETQAHSVTEQGAELLALGLELALLGPQTLVVRQVSPLLAAIDLEQMVPALLTFIRQQNITDFSQQHITQLFQFISQYVKQSDDMTKEKLAQYLVELKQVSPELVKRCYSPLSFAELADRFVV